MYFKEQNIDNEYVKKLNEIQKLKESSLEDYISFVDFVMSWSKVDTTTPPHKKGIGG
ncbi:TPA: hypothetical protein KPI46_003969 [Clostridioides difficile]|nr:hypothetical protein [Clostridioides difficile]HBE8580817.1 hypothetical protein [Clostridioides difficile]HBF0595773.1 hypothetical protein [Clostridioides difficile]HBG1796112.1 hypothetical protein [Clostridioides difficile]